MNDFRHPRLTQIEQLCGAIRSSIEEADEPGVVVALRHALNYAHLAGTYLGDDRLSPEADDALLSEHR